ncbi:SCY1-like protein 2 [Liolophura sinensis]|uniref:SCY1-like protein 2 n=1 Tax=Liolophura sinensis TaxID=3198878 RepID=UPI0031587EA3
MDVLNKLKSAVSSALPGIPLAKDFEMLGQTGSAGPGLLWKIHDGMKRTTKQEASVFVCEKKQLERYSRQDRELILDILKKGVSQLTRLRHPKILSVIHPMEESREYLAFATEPVFASLSNVLGHHDNLPEPLPKDLQDYKLYEVEIKYGLLQVAEALAFLHNSVKLLHRNICPQSILVNKSGSWKLAGFDFSVPNKNTEDQAPLFEFVEWDAGVPPLAQPNLDFLAPEYALTMTCSLASDMFSFGVLLYSLFNEGRPLYECHGQLSTFRKNADELKRLKISILGCVPQELRDYMKMLLNAEATVRPDADQVSKISYFVEDIGPVTLQYMDTLFQRDNLQKSQFFKGLPQILTKLPKRVNLQRILPALFKEAVNHDMIPFLLPSILYIAEGATNQEYVRCILPELIPIFRIQEPIQILFIFLKNMSLLLNKTPTDAIKTHVLPMVYKSLEAQNPQIQELCLGIIPTFAGLIDYGAMKNAIVPRIKRLCLGTSTLTVRVNCLLCLGKLLEFMDKWYVLDDILPMLQQIPTKEPAVLMSILGIYRVTMTHKKLGLTKDVIVNKVLPFLIPISFDNNLNLQQFSAFMTTVKEMFNIVESEHRAKLEQISSMQQEQRTIEFPKVSNENSIGDGKHNQDSMMDKFLSGFGLGGMFAGGTSSQVSSPVNPDLSTLSGGALAKPDTPKKLSPPALPEGRLPSQPAQVSLSLEEKKKLAREQEQQQRYKSQKAIAPSSSKAKTPTTQSKDLTSTLMNKNLTNLAKPNYNVSSSGYPQTSNSMYGQSNIAPSPRYNPSGPGNSALTSSSFSSQSSLGSGSKVDMSAFDSLIPSSSGSSNTGKKSLNQLSQNSSGSQSAMSPTGLPQQRMMGNMQPYGMMGNQGMMRLPNMMGNQWSAQGMGMSGLNGSRGQQPAYGQGFNGMGFPQHTLSPQNPQPFPGSSSQKLSQSDLNDLLG